jgi:hypothetical protein
VVVANHNWMDMVVSAEHDGTRTRLGLVRSANQARFTLPRSMHDRPGGVVLVADPVGSAEAFRTDPILVDFGARIVLSVENQITLSAHRVEAVR